MANYIIFSQLLTRNSSSRTQKNSPTRLVKASASLVGGMFEVTSMNCRREKFTKLGIGSGLLGTFP